MAQVKFLFGTLSQYNNLATKDDNSLYFITDTYEIYKGQHLYTSSYEVATTPSAVTSPKSNYVYIFTDKKYLAEYTADQGWVALTPEVTEDLSVSNALPLTQAVKSAIDNIQAAINTQSTNIEANSSLLAEMKPVLDELTAASGKGSVNEIAKAAAADAIAEMLVNGGEDFDTLQEMAEYLKNDKVNAAQISNDIANLKTQVGLNDGSTTSGSLVNRVEQLETTVGSSDNSSPLANRIDTLEERVNSIASTGGEANLVNDIQIGGTTIVENKIANFIITADGNGGLTINGTKYIIADLGKYVTVETYNTRVATVDEKLDKLTDNINTVNNTLGNRITELQSTMESNDAALSARIDGISIPELTWGSLA